jgi:alkylation response protein AidB-like acyl-CoA dehydrogenase
MDIRFIPTDEQVMLRDSARRWVAQGHVVDAPTDAHWAIFAEMGWLMAALPEEAGGLGGDAQDAAVIAEELGYGLVRAPFVEVAVTAAQLLMALAPDRVPGITEGRFRPILAHDETAARGAAHWIRTRAEREGGSWRLSGRKTGVIGAPDADTLLVTAFADEGMTLFEMPVANAPMRVFRTVDDRAAAELLLDGTPAVAVGPIGGACPAVLNALDHALVVESAEAVGAMQKVFDLTRDYLLTRHQYGRPISDFQALRHRLADMFIEVEQARSIVLRGLAGLRSADPRERSMLACATRARTAQAGAYVGAQGIQLHGGIGVTEEYPVGHYFKRLTAFALRHGTEAAQVERYAELSNNREEVTC